jgi:hypothetical protein
VEVVYPPLRYCVFHVSLGPIIGYQKLYGVGTGLGVQTPNLVATVTSSAEDVSIAVASVSCKSSLILVKGII